MGAVPAVSLEGIPYDLAFVLRERKPLRWQVDHETVGLVHRRTAAAHRRRHIGVLDDGPLAQKHGALDRILELADITGPGIGTEKALGSVGDRPKGLAVLLRI